MKNMKPSPPPQKFLLSAFDSKEFIDMCFTRHTALVFLQWNHVYLRHLLVEYWLIPWVDMLTGCWLIHWLMHNPHTDGVAADMLTEIGGLSTNTHVKCYLADMLLILYPHTQPTLLSLDLLFLVNSTYSIPMLAYFL